MANNVFANGREVSCKSGSGKSIASFPDVCMTPPENPATPPGVPVPYPNTGMTGDCTSGSKTVKISDKEAMLKNKSYFKKSMGDEAGAAAKKGVVSSKNRGKVYFTMWSMDVKIEGENAVRHLDMTTHNHGSAMNTGPWPFVDTGSVILNGGVDPCEDEKRRQEKGCDGKDPQQTCADAGLGDPPVASGMRERTNASVSPILGADGHNIVTPGRPSSSSGLQPDSGRQRAAWKAAQEDDCLALARCQLTPYSPHQCCPGQTPHHVVPNEYASSCGNSTYNHDAAPCICVEGASHCNGSHGMMHAHTKQAMIDHVTPQLGGRPVNARNLRAAGASITYGEAKQSGSEIVEQVFPASVCSRTCIEAQLDKYYKRECNMNEFTPMPITKIPSGRGDAARALQIALMAVRRATMAATRAARAVM